MGPMSLGLDSEYPAGERGEVFQDWAALAKARLLPKE